MATAHELDLLLPRMQKCAYAGTTAPGLVRELFVNALRMLLPNDRTPVKERPSTEVDREDENVCRQVLVGRFRLSSGAGAMCVPNQAMAGANQPAVWLRYSRISSSDTCGTHVHVHAEDGRGGYTGRQPGYYRCPLQAMAGSVLRSGIRAAPAVTETGAAAASGSRKKHACRHGQQPVPTATPNPAQQHATDHPHTCCNHSQQRLHHLPRQHQHHPTQTEQRPAPTHA